MSNYHIFYTRKDQLPTGVTIKAQDANEALMNFMWAYDHEEIIYITKLDALWSLQQTL